MAQDLRANTEVKVRVGEFVDVGDAFTPEAGITLGAADQAELLKHNGVATVDISGNTWAAVAGCDAWYDLTLTAGNVDTEGNLTVVVQDASVCLPVHVHFNVLSEAAYDSKYVAKDTGYMDVNVKAISEDTAAADSLELWVENAKGSDHKALISTDAQDLNASLHVDAKAISGSTGAADNVEANIGNLNATVSSRSSHTAANVWAVVTRALTDKAGFSLSTAGIQAIWDKATSGLTVAGSIGKLLVDNINATISSRSSHAASAIWSVATRALTDKAGFSLSTAGIQAIWDKATSALTTVGSIGKLLVDNINATISSRASSTNVTNAESNIRGADSDDLKDLSDQLDSVALEATVADLITRTKGLNAIYDSVALRALEATLTDIKGSGWTNETLKYIKELVDELESGAKPPLKANFTV